MKKTKETGITLVALIVTIIVLIILATIAINSIVQMNMIEKALGAAQDYEEAQGKEASDMDRLSEMLEEISGGNQIDEKDTIIYHVDTDKRYIEKVKEGEDSLNPKTFTPEKEGWIFVGWKESTEASAEVLTSKIKGEERQILYAVFKQDVTLTYYGNGATGGNVEPQTSQRYFNASGDILNPTITIQNNKFTKQYYHFKNWALGSKEGEAYDASEITLESNQELYAIWEEHLQEIALNIGSRTLSEPSNVAFDNTTPRTWDDLTYIVGITTANHYRPSNVTRNSVATSQIEVTSIATGYGVGLPFSATGGTTYKIEVTSNDVCGIAFYAQNGAFLAQNSGTYFSAPWHTTYGVIVCRGNIEKGSCYYQNLKLYKVL